MLPEKQDTIDYKEIIQLLNKNPKGFKAYQEEQRKIFYPLYGKVINNDILKDHEKELLIQSAYFSTHEETQELIRRHILTGQTESYYKKHIEDIHNKKRYKEKYGKIEYRNQRYGYTVSQG